MATDTTVNNLIINKLTKAQYDDIQSPSETELYLVEESIDTTPTSGSSNPVSSGGVYTALSDKIDKSSTSGLVKNDGTIDTSTYLTSSTAHQVPSGGNAGQVLKKSSATDYDYAWANQTQDYPSAYCKTAAGTAGKTAACTLWTATANTYLHIVIVYANTSASALTLNVNSTSAAPLYINGVVSSSTNYTLPAGSYIAFYDGANWYINTDGTIPNVLHKSSTSGLVKNDGTIDTNTYLTSHQDISGKEDKVDIVAASGATLTAEVGKYYTLSSVGTLAITLPTIAAGTTKVQTVTFYIAAGSSPAVTWTSTHTIIKSKDFTIEANRIYEISAAWNGIGWIIGQMVLDYIPPTINVKTKSTGNQDAALTVTDVNNKIVTDILYTEVDNNDYWENHVVKVQYSPTGYTGWCVFAKIDVTYNNVDIPAGSLISNWAYNTTVDFDIYY